MNGSAFVSVVTPVYNGGEFLDECMASVRAQSHAQFEHVILDNASTDETHAIASHHAAQDPRIRLHRNAHTLPVIDNWNRALELMSGDSRYCRILHADDTMHPECLERTVEVAERHPAVGIVGCFRLRGRHVQCEGLPEDREAFTGREIARLFLRQEVFAFAPTSNLLRADLVRSRRPFYPSAYLHADLAIYLDLLQSVDFGFVHDVLAYSREHGESITMTVAERNQTLLKEWLLLLQRYGPRFFSEAEMAELERSHLRRYYRNLVRGFVKRRERAYFDYHLAGLKEAGRQPTALDLLGAASRELLAAIAHPGKLRRHLGM
ncbi:MAG: glycosyltransferase family 2 protein [Rhodospirillales bacterium]|nr:glycosyltransferase family 2 protein [Rhodospirillales bacterium]